MLASLSEAGGNELLKVTSKPLPPRFATSQQLIHSKRAHAWVNAGSVPIAGKRKHIDKYFINKELTGDEEAGPSGKNGLRNQFGTEFRAESGIAISPTFLRFETGCNPSFD